MQKYHLSKIDVLPRGQNPLRLLLYSIMNLNPIWLALVGKARKGKKGRRKLMDVVEGCRYGDRQVHN
jgi:hypothetical protein